MNRFKIAVHGAAGRMGKRLVALCSEDPQLELAAALESEGHPDLGKDAGTNAGYARLGIPLTTDVTEGIDVIIDFSVAEAVTKILTMTVARNTPLVLATTGLDEATKSAVRDAAEKIPIVWAPNMSLAVNLLMKLTSVAADALKSHGSGVDVEIIERHHRFKEDAPSGTALKFGELIAGIMSQTRHVHGRQGRPGMRPRDEIGYHALRVGDNPGEHTIIFGMLGESIELAVKATNRDCYALGALSAAKFVSGREPGIYSMFDVLGL